MQSQTSGANAQDWLEASRGIVIRSYIEACVSTLSLHQSPFLHRGFYDELREIGVPYPIEYAPIVDPQLDAELQAWDALSDEALLNFEQELG